LINTRVSPAVVASWSKSGSGGDGYVLQSYAAHERYEQSKTDTTIVAAGKWYGLENESQEKVVDGKGGIYFMKTVNVPS